MCGIALVADARGRRSHDVVEQALAALVRLTHRGAPPETASIDGAGILAQIPWDVLADDLPAAFAAGSSRALGAFFMPRHRAADLQSAVEHSLALEGFGACHWRTVPVGFEAFDPSRRAAMPAILQVAALASRRLPDAEAALYRARVRIEAAAARTRERRFAVVSLSTRTVVYKGLLTPAELPIFYPDLRDPAFRSAIAVVHQRFSTNTAAEWGLAQPFHVLAHNGEISTVGGNRRWAGARLAAAGMPNRLGTAADQESSDSCSLDAAVHAWCAAGLDLPHALSRLVPPAWEHDAAMDPDVAAFYEHQASYSEPWDGPAAIAFTDGDVAGALLDRNGFRPARYSRTRDDRVYLGSEAGIFDLPGRSIVARGRLAPGGMLVVDTRSGEVLETGAARTRLAAQKPYRSLVSRTVVSRDTLGTVTPPALETGADVLRLRQRLFGCTQEEIDLILRPMAGEGAEAVGSMGDDAPLAALSRFNRLLPDYFRQRFAQVTNPAMDPLRERCVMSLRVLLGALPEGVSEAPPATPLVSLPSPVLDAAAYEQLAGTSFLRPVSIGLSFDASAGTQGLEAALHDAAGRAADAVRKGAALLLLTDRSVSAGRAAIPPLLATAAIHERLLADGLRLRASLVVETGEVRDSHQFAALCAYGASAVFPYLAFETVVALAGDTGAVEASGRYRHALEHGLLKILSKMGVTTFSGYCGSALFDVVGLDHGLVRRWFHGGGSPVGGATLADLAQGALDRHRDAYPATSPGGETAGQGRALRYPGFHSFRRGGEQHAYDPAIVRQLHKAAQPDATDAYRAFTALVDARQAVAVRDLLAWTPGTPIRIEEVEPAALILRRFFSAAMSVGALSPEAHETLAIAMNRLGGRSNSGEGGESSARFAREAGRDWSGSAVKQVASARFGVTPAYLRSADELQIKIAQGSKPGEGGQLPAAKVVGHIAALRHAQAGTTLISPPVHHDIYSIEDLAQLIFDLRRFHPSARIGVKLVSAAGVGIVAAGAAKAGADAILISGHNGGTGASPRASIKHAGLPWELGLADAHHVLTQQNLRDRVVLQVDGGLQRGSDVAVAAALGADEYGFGTAALVAVGCVMARQCHLDTCPAGIATQRPDLRARFKGTPEMVVEFLRLVAEDVRQTLAALGIPSLSGLVGRADLLEPRGAAAGGGRLDLQQLLTAVPRTSGHARRSVPPPAAHVDDVELPDAVGRGGSLIIRRAVRNVDRAVGAALAGRITARFGGAGLPAASVVLHLAGTAGQSLGAFLVPGLDIHLQGEANDYVGKGMHGGTLTIRRPREDDAGPAGVLAGNAVLYGATGGELFIRGAAGERFAVRNSGAVGVVEGIGDHGCEYMTGGTVVVLGPIGRNFASGMAGGTAFASVDAISAAGPIGVSAASLDLQDWARLESLLSRHWKLTGSPVAAALLGRGPGAASLFRKVAPRPPAAQAAGVPPLQTLAHSGELRQAVSSFA